MSIGSDPELRPGRSCPRRCALRPAADLQRTYRAGEYLRLDQLAGELGISATPVREALLNLRAEGLLVQQPRRGFMVLDVALKVGDPTGALTAYRSALELDPGYVQVWLELGRLHELKQEWGPAEQAYEQDDLERTVRLNHEFHRTINVAADSPKLTQFMSGITRYAPESVFPTVSGWPKQSIRDHRRVIAAFERRDTNRARMAMAEHFTIGSCR